MSIRLTGNAVVAALRNANLNVGDGEKPRDVGWTGVPGQSDFHAYIIVYPTGGGGVDGSIGRPHDDVTLVYQLTCVGSTREQTDWMRDKARGVMLNRANLQVAGQSIVSVEIDVPIATSRDDDEQPPLWFSADRFRVRTSPTA